MGQLVMTFTGLCMHMGPDAGLPPDVGHRVVAIDAPRTETRSFGVLPAHLCYLELASTSAFHLRMHRGHVRLANPSPSEMLSVDLSVKSPPTNAPYTSVPGLTTFEPGAKLRSSLHESGPPSWAAAYVDIRHGSISANMFPKFGIYTTWTVRTDGDPVLHLTPREGETVIWTLPSQASVGFFNATTDASDKRNDFVLYYLAMEGGIPRAFKKPLPGQADEVAARTHHDFGTTTSCSNSQYP